MPTVRIPLAGSYNSRFINNGFLSRSQRFINLVPTKTINPYTHRSRWYLEPIAPLQTYNTPAAGKVGTAITFTESMSAPLTIFAANSTSPHTVYYGTTSYGDIEPAIEARKFLEVVINGTTYFMTNTGGTGWYLDLNKTSGTFTADTTSGSPNLTNVSSTTNLLDGGGQLVTGTGIPAGTRVLSISGTTVTMTANATANGVGITVTNAGIGKILDADFQTSNIVGSFAELSGYVFYQTANGRIYNSDLNSITAYGANNYITADSSPDNGAGVFRIADRIVAMGRDSIDFFENAGNPSGSPLRRVRTLKIGISTALACAVYKDVLFFVSSATYGCNALHMLSADGSLKKLSPPQIDNILGRASEVVLSAFEYNGRTFVSLYANGNAVEQFWYCLEDDFWLEVTGEQAIHITGRRGGLADLYAVSRTDTSGAVYYTNISSVSGTYPQATIQTSKVDFGNGKRKFYESIELIGESAGESFDVSWSDDDGQTFSTAVRVTLSNAIQRAIAHRLGSGRQRQFKIVSATRSNSFRLSEMEITYSEGTA